jgi:protein-S-isoprenylcysteine O-methyltransferase Ste14
MWTGQFGSVYHMSFGHLLILFVLMAGVERAWEIRANFQAVRGEKRQGWSVAYFTVIHTAIFIGTAVEYFWLQRDMVGWLTALGGVLFSVSLVVRLAAIRALGRFWSVHLEIRQEHKLVTEGIYRYVRHPAYSAIMLEVVSVPLVGNAYGMLLLALLAYVPVLLWRWWCEEGEMVAKFGETYRAYQRAVPAFLPLRGRCDFKG